MKYLLFLLLMIPSFAKAQQRYSVVIDEIMADPTPAVGLPGNEWIELKNTTGATINIQGWRIGDASGQSGAMPNFNLLPDSFVIVCPASAVAAMSSFGSVIAVTSFPSLDNAGDQLYLKATNGTVIHSLSYTDDWYGNALKKEGGWTLEMIDTRNPCTGAGNWKASQHASGGTPGKKNSVDGINNDDRSPRLKRAYTTDNRTIILLFDEPLDSLSGAIVANYSIDGGLSFVNAATLSPLFTLVQLKTNVPLEASRIYNVSASGVKDCKGNSINANSTVRVGLPVDPVAGEFIINEILFDPRSGGYDYVEWLNTSTKIFDASKLYIANRNASGIVSSMKALSTEPFYIFPGDHIVETEDFDQLSKNYLVKNPGNVLIISSPPSFPDDKGDAIILNGQGIIIDELQYDDDWQFKLIDNAEGVALERVDPVAPTQDRNNWHSASSTAGYGTPTYSNSQQKLSNAVQATIDISPKIFSPDNDGTDDISSIQYVLNETGYVANIIIFDAAGRPVRHLVQNAILGLAGRWNWDGLDDKAMKPPIGTYIIFTEIFNLQGKKQSFRNAIVLARKL